MHSIRTPVAFVASLIRGNLSAPTVRCIEPARNLPEPKMFTATSAQQPMHLPVRFTSMLLAAIVTGAVLGSIEVMAAEQVAAARSAQQQTHQQLAAGSACRVGG